ncbi:MAG: DNA methyltransferase [bacterium]
MAITKSEFSAYIKSFQFKELFNDMGWNNDRTKQPIIVDDISFNISGVAEKSGFRIFICEPLSGNKIPNSVTRKKIEGKVTELFREHLIIFIDEHKQEQVWQLVVRKADSPTKISETRYSTAQNPELLYQRASGLFFTLDEEEKVTIIDVTNRVAENFQQNNERVTKKFYESFKKEHTVFLKFIEGIDDQLNMDWYASLMLNRLMFCYFIQKKGFLDNNKNYLQDKLKACKEKKGRNQFYSFYRDFLLALFHKGFGMPEQGRGIPACLSLEIGKIPYLNGGLFDEHEIERTYQNIIIDDKAFERLFDFFDQYEWHLDTRESASGKDINPDVIGYIFEKYINDRAQMGAYYTKEDITDYISKNCIIPWLFDEVKRQCTGGFCTGGFQTRPFADNGWLWQMVKASEDEYIYDAVKYGVQEEKLTTDEHGLTQINNGGWLFSDLPAEIQKGFVPELEKKAVDGNGPWLWELRKDWNKPAPADIALPTEIYREVIERRKRYADIKSKIANGEIQEINDFITYNLNIRQFAQDVIETTEDAEFIRYFYKALSSITILDPTCGSGAFLFAAMNILEPLYEACILRMKNFTDESGKGKHKFFEETLAQVNSPEHPNMQYFIFKSIILNNLYGVDIMNEAVEIAKLRLFLKLVATVDADYRKPNLGLEPLPDVDFNIRAGNTLVGYATEKQLVDSLKSNCIDQLELPAIKEKCDIVGRTFARYKEIQLQGNADFEDFKNAKDNLNQRLNKLRDELDKLLHKQHYSNVKYEQWLATHQPFHWFAEFYEIIHGKGGFDVVIGNPPYVEYSKVKNDYTVQGYKTESCGNLYAFVVERSLNILTTHGRFGMIVPIALPSTPRMSQLRDLLSDVASPIWCTNFADRPGALFNGVHQKVSIVLCEQGRTREEKRLYTTAYKHWYGKNESDERTSLMTTLVFVVSPKTAICWMKSGNSIEQSIYSKLHQQLQRITKYFAGVSEFALNMRMMYWGKCFTSRQESNEYKHFRTDSATDQKVLVSVFNSTFYFWYWELISDGWHITSKELDNFFFNMNVLSTTNISVLVKLCENLMADLNKKKVFVGTKQTEYEYYHRLSKPIIDQIDSLLAQHYGFTHEELDFIINYDIKYRMGKELGGGEEDEE